MFIVITLAPSTALKKLVQIKDQLPQSIHTSLMMFCNNITLLYLNVYHHQEPIVTGWAAHFIHHFLFGE